MGRETPAFWLATPVLLFLTFVCSSNAVAQEPTQYHSVAVLPAAYGEGAVPEEWVDAIVMQLHAQADLLAFDRDEAMNFMLWRFPEPEQIDLQIFLGLLEAGEDAFFEMHYEESYDHLSSEAVQAASRAYVAMGADPELADAVRRALLAKARTALSLHGEAAAEEAIRENLTLFPSYVATTDYYPPSFVESYADIRQGFLTETHELRIVTPQESCTAELNGHELDGQGEIAAAVVDGEYAVRVSCFGLTGRVHHVDTTRTRVTYIDPAFDQAFRSTREGVELQHANANDFSLLRRIAAGYADILDVEQVWFVAAAEDHDWGAVVQIVQVDLDEGGLERGVRIRPDENGHYRLGEGIASILGGVESDFVKRDVAGDWPISEATELDTDTAPPVGVWVLVGVGAAGLINGGIFAVLENQTFDDFETCRETPSCDGGPEASDLKSEGERQRLASLISFGVGASAALAGILWLVLYDGDSEPQSDGVTVVFSPDSIGLRWVF